MITVECIDHPFPHHGKYAGYKMLVQYAGDKHILDPSFFHHLLAPFPDAWLSRLVAFHPNWYTRRAFAVENEIALKIITQERRLFHFLYGEHSFRWSGRVNHILGHRHRLVATYHQLPEFFYQRRSQFSYLPKIDAVILVGSNQRDFFDQILGPERVHVIPHGINTRVFVPNPDPSPTTRPIQCLTVGSNYRDFDVQIQVIENINRSVWRGVEFVMIGGAKHREQFKDIEHVTYLSGISDEELVQWYQASDILLLPLTDATACNALLEGMSCGLPVVVTDVGGVRDYADETCAALVPPNDSQTMTEHLLTLLEDADCRHRMGQAARRKAEDQLDWQHVARRVQQVYTAVW
jgi:glycosyltransferase involved in cell wall biosynthesis